jgi:hypothetical protein
VLGVEFGGRFGWNHSVILLRAHGSEESFFLRSGQNANAVTIKLVLIEQFEYLGHGERVVVQLKEHDPFGSLMGKPNAHSRAAQGTYRGQKSAHRTALRNRRISQFIVVTPVVPF